MVQTTSHIFSGKVDIESNLLVGSSHLFVDTTNNRVGITTPDPHASLHVSGNAYVESNVGVGSTIELDGDTGIITATEFRGDGSNLVGVLTSLENATQEGNTTSTTVQFTNADTSLVASGNVVVTGNVTASTFVGDGSQLTGIATDLQAITDNGNVTSNTVQFTNTGTSLTASGNIEVEGTVNICTGGGTAGLTEVQDTLFQTEVSSSMTLVEPRNVTLSQTIHQDATFVSDDGSIIHAIAQYVNGIATIKTFLRNNNTQLYSLVCTTNTATGLLSSYSSSPITITGSGNGDTFMLFDAALVAVYKFFGSTFASATLVANGGSSPVSGVPFLSYLGYPTIFAINATGDWVIRGGGGDSNGPGQERDMYNYNSSNGTWTKYNIGYYTQTKALALTEYQTNTFKVASRFTAGGFNAYYGSSDFIFRIEEYVFSNGSFTVTNEHQITLANGTYEREDIFSPVRITRDGNYVAYASITTSPAETKIHVLQRGANGTWTALPVITQISQASSPELGLGSSCAFDIFLINGVINVVYGRQYANGSGGAGEIITLNYVSGAWSTLNTFTGSNNTGIGARVKISNDGSVVTDNAQPHKLSVYDLAATGKTCVKVALDPDMASNAARIGVLETDLTSNATRVTNLEAANVVQETLITNLRTDLDSNAVRVSSLETDRTSNTLRISILESANIIQGDLLTDLRTDVTSNTGRIADLETANGVQETLITDLRTDLDSNVVRVSSLETDRTSNTLRISILESANIIQGDLLTDLRTDVTSNTGRISSLETDLTDNVIRITNLESADVTHASDISSLQSANTVQGDLITDLRTDVTSNTGRIADLETANGVQATLITNLTTDLSSNDGRITILETANTVQQGLITELQTANGVQATLITNLTTDLSSNDGRITILETANTVQQGLITELQTANGVQATLITNLTTDLSSNDGRITILETANTVQQDLITELQTANGVQATLITNLTTDLSSNDGRITILETANTVQQDLITELQTANGVQATLITNLTTDLSSNDGRITILETANTVQQDLITELQTANGVQATLITNLTTDLSSNDGRITILEAANTVQQGLITELQTANGVQATLITNLTNDLSSNDGRITILETTTGGGTLTLQGITDLGNTTTNVIQFSNATTGFVTTANAEIGSNISIAGLTANKIPIVGANKFLEDSLIGRSNGKIVISSDLEVSGNIVVVGNSYIIESNSLVINDRVLGIANNNTSHELDVGIIMGHPGKNVALIHHGESQGDQDPHDHTFTIGYTQNSVIDNHIFDDSNNITVEILGNLITQNNLTVGSGGSYYGDGTTLTGVALANDLTSAVTRITTLETANTVQQGLITELQTANGVQATLITNLTTDLSSNDGRITILETANTVQQGLITELQTANGVQATLITNLTNDLSSNDGRITILETANTVQQGLITELQTANGVQATLITNLTTDLSSNDGRITILEAANTVQQGLITELQTANGVQATLITNLTNDLSSNDGRITILETANTVQQGLITELQTANGVQAALITNLTNDLSSNDARITTLEVANTVQRGLITELQTSNTNIWSNLASNSYRIGTLETELAYPTFTTLTLDGIANKGNTTSNVLKLTNATTGLVADGNVHALKFHGDGSELTGISSNLDQIANNGNVTSNTIQFSNAITSLTAASNVVVAGNVTAGYFVGDGSNLTGIATTLQAVSDNGNVTSNTIQFSNATTGFITTSNIEVGGNAVIDSNLDVHGSANVGPLTVSNTFSLSNVATIGTTKTFVVTVSNASGANKYYIDGELQATIELHQNQTYIFDLSSSTLLTHPFVFQTTNSNDGTTNGTNYDTGITNTGTYGSDQKRTFVVPAGAPTTLYYYCTAHSGMGATISISPTAELIVSGRVVASGNVEASKFIGDGSQLTGISGATTSDLQVVTTNGATTSQAIQFTNTGTSLAASGAVTAASVSATGVVSGASVSATGGITAAYFTGDGSNVNIGEMTAETIPYVDSNKQLRDSHITRTADKTVITSNLQVEGNLFVTGNTYAINSENTVINDRIIGLANNNTSTTLDVGLMLQYPQKNVAMIHHGITMGSPHNGQLTLGYTQSGFEVDNITKDPSNNLTLNVWGHVVTQNNITVGAQGSYYGDGTTLTGVALETDLSDNVTRISALETATIISNSSGITTGFTKGDLIYASADNVLNKLAVGGTDGYVLKVTSAANKTLGWAAETGGGGGSTPWVTNGNKIHYPTDNVGINVSDPAFKLDVHGTANVGALTATSLSVGGQTLALATDLTANANRLNAIYNGAVGDIIYVDGTNSLAKLSIGSANQVLTVQGGLPAWVNASGGGGGGGSSQWTTVNTNEIYYDGNVGIANTNPGHDLSVGSNLFVDDDGSNVLVVTGNTAMSSLTLGQVSIAVSYGLNDILNVSNTSSNIIQLTNATTGLVATGNVHALKFIGDGSGLTGITSNLDQIVNNGNVTSNTVQFSNAITSLTAASNVVVTGNVTAGSFLGDGSLLTGISSTLQAITDSGNVTSNTVQFSNATTGFVTTANVEVGGIIVSTNKSASGGTESTVGSDKLHQFTTAGMFSVTGADISVEFLIIGGGGGGGRNHAGGGGAGQFVSGTITLPRGVYPIMVGRGGLGGYRSGSNEDPGQTGGESQALGFIARGGGGGGTRNGYTGGMPRGYEGLDGGSGGGGAGTAADASTTITAGGYGAESLGIMLGTTQAANNTFGGYGGGMGSSGVGGSNAGHGGGGGGAGGQGGDASGGSNIGGYSGNGGAGLASSITGTSVTYAGGGSGGRWASGTVGTTTGGGGVGGNTDGVTGGDGTNGLGSGGGGGGGGNGLGGHGGDGIVILRWTP